MPRDSEHEIVELARLLESEIEGDAREHAAILLAEVLPDTLPVTAARAKAWVREQWLADPVGFPQQLLERMAPTGLEGLRTKLGLKKYLLLVKGAFAHQDDDDPDLVGLTGRRRTRVAPLPGEPEATDLEARLQEALRGQATRPVGAAALVGEEQAGAEHLLLDRG